MLELGASITLGIADLANPDDHTWKIAFNPAWPVDAEGHVKFGV